MALVHAYRRTAPVEVEVYEGYIAKFEPNEAGHQVCEVPEGPSLDRLLEISEAYVVYGIKPQAQAEPDEDDDTPLSKYILTRDDTDATVDLRELDRAALLAFIAEQDLDYKPRANTPDDTIRDRIVALLTGA